MTSPQSNMNKPADRPPVRPATSTAATRTSDDDSFGQWALGLLVLIVIAIAILGLVG
jgi:hypothetical protein